MTTNSDPVRGGHRASGLTGGTSSSFSDKIQPNAEHDVIDAFAPDLETEGIAGYTYKDANFTRAALVERLIQEGRLSPGARGMNGEDALNQLAADHATSLGEFDEFDRDDEETFDTDDFPKVILEDMVTIHEHAALGREYWDTPDYDDEPRTAESALEDWIQTQELDFLALAEKHAESTGEIEERSPEAWDELAESMKEQLFQFTYHGAAPEHNIAAIESGATYMGIDLAQLGSPLPTGHNLLATV
jgi:hypothetical protein